MSQPPSLGAGGMPRSRYQQAFDDFLIPEEAMAPPDERMLAHPGLHSAPTPPLASGTPPLQQPQPQQPSYPPHPRANSLSSNASFRPPLPQPPQGLPQLQPSFTPQPPADMFLAGDGGPYMNPMSSMHSLSSNMQRTTSSSSGAANGRRHSNTSKASSLFNWRAKKSSVHDEFNGDDDVFDDFSSFGSPRYPSGSGSSVHSMSYGNNNMTPFQHQQQQQYFQQQHQPNPETIEGATDLGMNQLTSLRDRDRYPTISNANNAPGADQASSGGRTMSMRSMTNSTFDTTPIIPILSPAGPSKNHQYRKNLTMNQRRVIRSSDGGGPGSSYPSAYDMQQQLLASSSGGPFPSMARPQNNNPLQNNMRYQGGGSGGGFGGPGGPFPQGGSMMRRGPSVGSSGIPPNRTLDPMSQPRSNTMTGYPTRPPPPFSPPGPQYREYPGSPNAQRPYYSQQNPGPYRPVSAQPPPSSSHDMSFQNRLNGPAPGPAPGPLPLPQGAGPMMMPPPAETPYLLPPQSIANSSSSNVSNSSDHSNNSANSNVGQSSDAGTSPYIAASNSSSDGSGVDAASTPNNGNISSPLALGSTLPEQQQQQKNPPVAPSSPAVWQPQTQPQQPVSDDTPDLNMLLQPVSMSQTLAPPQTEDIQPKIPRHLDQIGNAHEEPPQTLAPAAAPLPPAFTTTPAPPVAPLPVSTASPAAVSAAAAIAAAVGVGATRSQKPPQQQINGSLAAVYPSDLSMGSTSPRGASDSMSRLSSNTLSSSSLSPDNYLFPSGAPAQPRKEILEEEQTRPELKTSHGIANLHTNTPTLAARDVAPAQQLTTPPQAKTHTANANSTPTSTESAPDSDSGSGSLQMPLSTSSPKYFDAASQPSLSTPDQFVTPKEKDGSDASISSRAPSSAESSRILELTLENQVLMNEVRLIAFELADSVKREMGVENVQGPEENSGSDYGDAAEDKSVASEASAESLVDELSLDSKARARMVVQLQKKLDMERRKRVALENRLNSIENNSHIDEIYDKLSLQNDVMKKEHELLDMKLDYEESQKTVEELTAKCAALEKKQRELEKQKIEAVAQHKTALESLKTENNSLKKELTALLPSITPGGILATSGKEAARSIGDDGPSTSSSARDEKVRAIEAQRDALRDALRSHRELKDHEIRQLHDRVRQLEIKWEKERLATLQLQQKLVLGSGSSSNGGSLPISSGLGGVNTARSSSSSGNTNSMVQSTSNGSLNGLLGTSPNVGAVNNTANGALPSPSSEANFNLTPPVRRGRNKGSFYSLSFGSSSSNNLLDSVASAGGFGSSTSTHTGGIIRSSSPAPLTLTTGMASTPTLSSTSGTLDPASHGGFQGHGISNISWLDPSPTSSRLNSPTTGVPSLGSLFANPHDNNTQRTGASPSLASGRSEQLPLTLGKSSLS